VDHVNEQSSSSNALSSAEDWSRTLDQNDGESGGVKERAQQAAQTATQAASEAGQKAKETIEQNREQAASGMERAAEMVRGQVGEGSGLPAQAGTKVADTMESAATYLREHSTDDMMGDMERFVREHPAQAVAGAVIAGFVIGRVLR
jgi:ElaB/YqjD/DUF883 family membrane-anchored ribosome-binding protein